MPSITLTSHSVAYNLYTLLVAADPSIGRSCRGLVVQVPAATIESGNTNAIVKVGRVNSTATPTSVAKPEFGAAAGDPPYRYPTNLNNDISLTEKWINCTAVDSVVVYCDVEMA